MQNRRRGKRKRVGPGALRIATPEEIRAATPKHNVALKIMLKYNWNMTKGLGKNDQGITAPIKACKAVRRYESVEEEDESKKREEVIACVNSLQQLSDVWNAVEVKESEGGRERVGFNTIFEDEEYQEIGRGSALPQLPEARAYIGELVVNCLIDTGSQITCIAHEFWECHLEDQSRYPIMPVTSMQIKGAMGQKSQKISRLVLIPLCFGEIQINTPCLIVPKLIRSIILGVNWLDNQSAEIKCGEKRELIVTTERGRENIELINSGVVKSKSGKQLCGGIRGYANKSINVIEKSHVLNLARETEQRIAKLVDGLKLDDVKKKRLKGILDKYNSVFLDRPGLTDKYIHEIKMVDETPFVKRSYPIPFAYREKVDHKINELEALGIISRRATPYASPLTYTLKKDGTVRILLDARELNTKMVGEVEKPPLTSEILQQFHGVTYLTTLDLDSAYFQIPISEESRKYTGFVYNGKSFVYNVLPQGLKTSVGSFSRAMDKILGGEVRAYCTNYLDDLVVFSCGDFDEHLNHLGAVLGRLQAANMTCTLEKCQFLFREVKMLGHVITTQGVRMDPDKISAIKNFPAPKKVKQVRGFLGLCNYYRRFADKYGASTQVLCDLLQKNRPWRWTTVEQNAFENVKSLFLESVMLTHHDPNKIYYLQTDSSGFAIGSELYQLDNEGNHHVIAFVSKSLKGAELKWTVSEQELYAIIYSLHKFETYLRGVRLVIRTDHQALSFLKTWRLYSARVTRWILYLNQFDFKVEYVKGKENIGPDILSRYSQDAINVQEEKVACPEVAAFAVDGKRLIKTHLENLEQLQDQDEFLGEVIEHLKGETRKTPTRRVTRYLKNYKLEDRTLYYKTGNNGTVLAIPSGLSEDLVKLVHQEIGHAGGLKTGQALKSRYFWPRMGQQIKWVVKTCRLCQLAKREIRPTVGPGRSIITKKVGELAMADLYGPLPRSIGGVRFIFVIQDSFSRYIQLYKLKVANTSTVLNCVELFIKKVKVEAMLTDNGSQFSSKRWNQSLERLGIKVMHTSVRNPGPNITERVNKELGRIFRIYCHEKHTKWPKFLKDIERTYNNTMHCTTGFSPNEVVFGKQPQYSLDKYMRQSKIPKLTEEEVRDAVRENQVRNAEKRQQFYNIKKRLVTYEIGTFVKLKRYTQSSLLKKQTKKFSLLFEGPFIIAGVPFSNTYTLVDPKTKEIRGDYSAIHLARYYFNETEKRQKEYR